ncbi:DNA-binding protein [Cytobacillus luteolus]|uniref:DNA-binding protein n=1 Tax=Litchfieldia luteola TaxID=682179 RepID=UPI001AE86F13|nr:DNA-binding protein [Cytobacillus luteolus]MBP1944649.1 hypothetical protein [Cytobacillus luteolus]
MNEYGLFSKDVALKLNINSSTLRQWCLSMEKEGYEFERNDKDQRIFYNRDITVLLDIKNEIEKTRNRDNAIKSIVSREKATNNTEKTLSVNEENRDIITVSKEDLAELIQSSVEKAIEKEREAMFKAFEKKLNDTIEHRDRYLVHQLNESMEQKRLEIAATQEEKPKGFLSRLFGK